MLWSCRFVEGLSLAEYFTQHGGTQREGQMMVVATQLMDVSSHLDCLCLCPALVLSANACMLLQTLDLHHNSKLAHLNRLYRPCISLYHYYMNLFYCCIWFMYAADTGSAAPQRQIVSSGSQQQQHHAVGLISRSVGCTEACGLWSVSEVPPR